MRQLQWYALQYSKVTISCTQQYQVISAQYWNYTIVKHLPIENFHCNCNHSKPASHGSQERDSIVAFDKVVTNQNSVKEFHTNPLTAQIARLPKGFNLWELADGLNDPHLMGRDARPTFTLDGINYCAASEIAPRIFSSKTSCCRCILSFSPIMHIIMALQAVPGNDEVHCSANAHLMTSTHSAAKAAKGHFSRL